MIILTGGAGFIGSNLLWALNRAGIERVVVVDNLENADKCRNLARTRFIDLIDKRDFLARLPALAGQVRAVLHLGACSSTTQRDGRYLLENNTDYSKRLLAWCLANRVQFIYASSASVYGDGQDGFREDPDCEAPLNGYAFSKWAFDQHVRRLPPGTASQVVGLRYFNVYGPQELHKEGMCSPMLSFHRQLEATGRIELFAGSEGFQRDFVHVEDCCAVNLFFLERPALSGIFNCGTGSARSFSDVARAMAAAHPGAAIAEIEFPSRLRGRYQAFTRADLQRLRAAGYDRPFLTLEQGVGSYAEMLRAAGGYRR